MYTSAGGYFLYAIERGLGIFAGSRAISRTPSDELSVLTEHQSRQSTMLNILKDKYVEELQLPSVERDKEFVRGVTLLLAEQTGLQSLILSLGKESESCTLSLLMAQTSISCEDSITFISIKITGGR